MTANQLQQLIWTGLVRQEARKSKGHLVSFFGDCAFAYDLNIALDANELSGSGEAEGGRVDGATHQFAGLNPPVFLVQRYG
jgi:hypothetical protein